MLFRSQATLRIVKVFWGLDAQLAYARHFPAINWLTSYSLYLDNVGGWFDSAVRRDWSEKRLRMIVLLQEESELDEIVQLVGMDALSPSDRLKLEAARSVREDFLQQDAFNDVDAYSPLEKQYLMMKLVLDYYDSARAALEKGVSVDELVRLPVREAIGRSKYIPTDRMSGEYDVIAKRLASEIDGLVKQMEEDA